MFTLLTPSGTRILYKNPQGLYPVNAHQSALLAEAAIKQAYELAAQKDELPLRNALASLKAIEICAGNGPAAVALKTIGVGHVTASDINPKALEATQANASFNNVQLDAVQQEDAMSSGFVEKYGPTFDLIVCNPPCAPAETVTQTSNECVKRAADGGPLGTDILLRLIQTAPNLLKPKGRMVIMLTSGSDVAAVVNALDVAFGLSWFTSPGTPIAAPIPPTPGSNHVEQEDRGKKLLENDKMLVWGGGEAIFRLTWAIIACNESLDSLKDLTLNERLPLYPYGWPPSPHPKTFTAAQVRFQTYLASVYK